MGKKANWAKIGSLIILSLALASCVVQSTTTSKTTSSSTMAAATTTVAATSALPPGRGQVPPGTPPNGGQPPGGDSGSSASTTGTATYTQSGDTVSKSDEAITASGQNTSVIMITDSGVFTLTDSTVSTTGETSSMDDSSFYGLNAAVLAKSGSTVILTNVKVTTTGSGANGVFATGEGTVINLTDVTIDCTNTGAHGVDATYGGTLNLDNVDISTAGNGASAAIATDRGGGTINVKGGTVITTGTKSPPIYSTGVITVTSGDMKATNSEAVVIEGKNSVNLTGTVISGSKNWGVLIYQSMSGDAEVGMGSFSMAGGMLTAAEGPMFYATNTEAVINLDGVTLANPSGILLKASAGDWGTSGGNGADVTFTADRQTLDGDIICDEISTVSLILKNSTTLTGAVNNADTAKSLMVTLDGSSTWEVTGDSYISGLTDSHETFDNIHANGYTVYYDASNSANSWLNGETYDLTGGGKLAPVN